MKLRCSSIFAILFLTSLSLTFSQSGPVSQSRADDESLQKAIILREGKWHNISLVHSSGTPDVEISMQYDIDSLRIKAMVKDNHFRDSERGWRHGDGFFFNFAFPGKSDTSDTENFYAYGFSLENKKPVAVLVNKDGNYLLSRKDNYAPKIMIDSVNHTADYFISIPWVALYPFNPLMEMKAGINIIYISQNDDRSRKILKYVDDPYYDTEVTNKRRFAALDFVPSDMSNLKIACRPESRLQMNRKTKLKIAVYSPEKMQSEISCSITDTLENVIADKKFKIQLAEGRNIFDREIEVPEQEGIYYLSVKLNDTASWKDSFLRLNRDRIRELKDEIAALEIKGNTKIFQNSISALNYYAGELETKIKNFTERKDPLEIKTKLREISELIKEIRLKGSIYTNKGFLLSAFKSEADSTLQPFSIYLPENFDASKTYNLLVTLHGSGVNELWSVNSAGKEFAGTDNIIIGPRGRDLSSWYTGATENDIVQLINSIKGMFRINRTVLHGFSMGGYGVWRFSLLHADLFDGAIVISGIPFNLKEDIPEYDIRKSTGAAKKIPFLVIHGTDDHSLDIKYTDDFIASLKKESYDIEYIRIPGAGHGNFKTKEYITDWLNKKHLLK